MNKQFKKYLIGTIISYSFVFIWIFVTVFLTDGKEINDFSSTDKKIFIGFIIIEVITFIISLIFAVKAGKNNPHKNPQIQQYIPKTKQEKIIMARGVLLLICTVLLSNTILVIGIKIGKKLSESYDIYFKLILAICCSVPALLIIVNILLKNNYIRKIENKKIRELHQYIISHREFAEETSAKKLSYVKRLKCLTDIYATVFSVFAVGVAFSSGILYSSDIAVPLSFVTIFLFLCSFSRIRFPVPKAAFEEDKTYISTDEYPELYKIAKNAADTLHCSGEIKIAVLADCNAGIAKFGNIYSVQLGVILLCTFSNEELYNILLHEFSHMTSHNNLSSKEGVYNTWLCNGGTPHFLSKITSMLYCYSDSVYNLQYNLYLYASSILHETAADQAMARYGNASIAASSLLKLKYYDLFNWEKGTYDEECMFASEKPEKKYLSNEIDSFRKAIKMRANDWKHLVDIEILSQSASHPTLKMRLDSLGVTDFQIIEAHDSQVYEDECNKALNHVEELIYAEQVKTYEEDRKSFYLEPKDKVDNWEAARRPLIAEEYADINFALRQLGRVSEANELCERAMTELTDAASYYAYFMKGCYLLHSYDDSGIEYIYHAIENNSNYIDEGLNIIGEFCCLTGRQEELDIYRQKAINLIQKEKDEYSQIGTLSKNDNLTSEQLPDGMLDEILTYIQSVDGGFIKKIYLVRKTISDNFFTSAFVIQFDPLTEETIQDEVLHKIFCHLDTCSNWQFSLFNYSSVANVKLETINNSCVYTSSKT